MSTIVYLVSDDGGLLQKWRLQVPPKWETSDRRGLDNLAEVRRFRPVVVVLDLSASDRARYEGNDLPTVYVGEPGSVPFERYRSLRGDDKIFLSYQDSCVRLAEFLPILGEISRGRILLNCTNSRAPGDERRVGGFEEERNFVRVADCLEDIVAAIGSHEALSSECKRMYRALLRSSKVVPLVSNGSKAISDCGKYEILRNTPLWSLAARAPAVLDGEFWASDVTASEQMAVRSFLHSVACKLVVPMHQAGDIRGFICLGVREDGKSYSDKERDRAVDIARIICKSYEKNSEMVALSGVSSQFGAVLRKMPEYVIVQDGREVPRRVPVVVRDLLGRAKQSGESLKILPAEGQPWRVHVGRLDESDSLWARWEYCEEECLRIAGRLEAERRRVLSDIALTVGHEIGNNLVSIAAWSQAAGCQGDSVLLKGAVLRDIDALRELNNNCSRLATAFEEVPVQADLRDLVSSVGRLLSVKVEVGPLPILVTVRPVALEWAMSQVVRLSAEGAGSDCLISAVLKVRGVGEGSGLIGLISLRGGGLELEGVLPEPRVDSLPRNGRLAVLTAKEVIRSHGGVVKAEAGMEGVEISWEVRGIYYA